ncbi:PREDICTED: sphingosine kinase 1-like [Priapulus caudatus]|uniref:Sphingosine kinase 1-like n=1 Tax=Priapulus caudatus TaxID=37621 RepID=A0ABM1EN63_PRICU|nr:PREDICTED: sphingosine kinase 1-like [Priapulus caudatus]
MRSRDSSESTAFITVYAYTPKKKKEAKGRSRRRTTISFAVNKSDNYEENERIAQQWKVAILCVLRTVQTGQELRLSVHAPYRRMLVIINPYGGQGKARKIFEDNVSQIFTEADIYYKLMTTEYSGHATEYVRTLDLTAWEAIVVCAGDGIVYEVYNGLMQRPDWQEAILMPVGVLPGGSGNALAASINWAARLPYKENFAFHSALVVAQGSPTQMDLVALDLADGRRLYSFLAVAWGLVSDVDIESERWRPFGPMRFFLGFLARVVTLRTYRGRVSYLPARNYTKHLPPAVIRDASTTDDLTRSASVGCGGGTYEHVNGSVPSSRTVPNLAGFCRGLFQRSQSVGAATLDFPGTDAMENADDDGIAATTTRSNGDVGHDDRPHDDRPHDDRPHDDRPHDDRPHDDRPHDDRPHDDRPHGDSGRGDGPHDDGPTPQRPHAEKNGRPPRNGEIATTAVSTPLLAPLGSPVPPSWVVVDDDFVLACPVYQTHLGSDSITVPYGAFADGVIHLAVIRRGVTRKAMLTLFREMEVGRHAANPNIELIPCEAFRLEPDMADEAAAAGIMTIDGEQIACGPIQGQVLPGVARVIAVSDSSSI